MRKKDDLKWATKLQQIEKRKAKERKRTKRKYRFDRFEKKNPKFGLLRIRQKHMPNTCLILNGEKPAGPKGFGENAVFLLQLAVARQ